MVGGTSSSSNTRMGKLPACMDSPMYMLLSIYIIEHGPAVQ